MSTFSAIGSSPPPVDLDRLKRPVLFVAPRPFATVFGGLEVQFSSTAEALRRLGLSVRTLDPYDREALDDVGLVHVFGSDYPVQQLVSLVAARGIPVVVSSIYFPTNTGRVIDAVTGWLPRTAARFQRLVLRTASVVLPNSENEAALLARVHGVAREKIRVIPNGFGVNRLGGQAERFRQKYLTHVPAERPIILSVARVEPRKNTHVLLEASRGLGAVVVLLGAPNPSEAQYAERVRRLCESEPNRALWIPGVPADSSDLADAYAAAHVHALPSWFETPGLSSLEAGANGCNLVAGLCRPVEEYLAHVALLVRPGEVPALRHGLERALAAPRDQLGQAAFIRERFSWDAVARFTAAAYVRALA